MTAFVQRKDPVTFEDLTASRVPIVSEVIADRGPALGIADGIHRSR